MEKIANAVRGSDSRIKDKVTGMGRRERAAGHGIEKLLVT
jgi:hypothetical protein